MRFSSLPVLLAGSGIHADFPRPADGSAPEEGLPRRRSATAGFRCTWKARRPISATSTDTCSPPRSRTISRPSRRRWSHEEKKDWEFFRQGRARCLLAARRAGVPRRTERHRRWPEGAQREAGRLGHRGPERLAGTALLRQVVQQADTGHHRRRRAGRPLQRVRRHRQLHQGRPRRHRAQQLDQLLFGRAVEHHLRHRARQGPPHSDGRIRRTDPQRRRFRHQRGRHHHHGDHHQRLQRLRSQRHSRVCARAQGDAVFGIDRRFRAHHEGRQQRRLCQQLAGGRSQDQRDREPGTGPEERHPAAHARMASSSARISRPIPSC